MGISEVHLKDQNASPEANVCNLDQDQLPHRYMWDENLKNGFKSRFENENATVPGMQHPRTLPVIDLSLLSSSSETDKKKLIKEIGSAAEHWGFFQVVNHGVPEEIVEAMMSHGMDFFHNLPVEVKERGIETDPLKHTYYHGYGGRFQHLRERVPWLEYMGESYHPVNGASTLLQKFWPGAGNPAFCVAADKYCAELVKLGKEILQVLAKSLELKSDEFSKHFEESKKYQAHWRFNHYPACPAPSSTLGLGPHTDPCAITIVTQDEVGGFQLMNEGNWFDVQPLKGSFLVNVGDCLHAWTNGRFSSVLHRVLANKAERLSIVFPFSPSSDYNICIPSSLIDQQHPLKYTFPIEWHHLSKQGKNVKAQQLSSKLE